MAVRLTESYLQGPIFTTPIPSSMRMLKTLHAFGEERGGRGCTLKVWAAEFDNSDLMWKGLL